MLCNYNVNKLSHFMQNPIIMDCQAVKRVLRYLKGNLEYCIRLKPSKSLILTAYSDADWGSCPLDRKSVSGMCVYYGDSLISWPSKKHVVSGSSTKWEYRALALASIEVT